MSWDEFIVEQPEPEPAPKGGSVETAIVEEKLSDGG